MRSADALRGSVALVTGAGVRVGRALALALADAGCDVAVHYGSSADAAETTRREAEAKGVRAATFRADLAAPDAGDLVEAVEVGLGPVEILVNSAALFLEGGLAETTPEIWERQFAVNLRAPFLLAQRFWRRLPERASGQIVNVVDARIFRPAGDHFAYRLTKAALHAMTATLARDLAPRVRVNAVALGAILPPPGEDDGYLERLAESRIPLERPGSPESVAASVLHLVSSDFLTGVTLPVDGGEFL